MADAQTPDAAPASYDSKTVHFIVEHTKGSLRAQMGDVDALDSKALTVFGVASTVIGLAAFAFQGQGDTDVTAFVCAAAAVYIAVAFCVLRSARGAEYTDGFYATSLWDTFKDLPEGEIELGLATAIPKHFNLNLRIISSKAGYLGWAMKALALQTMLVAAALVASRLDTTSVGDLFR